MQAAMSVLQTQGAAALTLDMVAKQAQVSKGGLLHHYPSKERLIEALLRYLYDEFETCVQALYDQDSEPDAPGRWARAYARASFDPTELPIQVSVSLAAYLKDNEQLRDLMQKDLAIWEARLASDGISPARAAVIRLVSDSYWMERLLKVETQVPADQLLGEVLSLIR